MKKWKGMDVHECPECGFSTVDPDRYAEHMKRSKHKEQPILAETPATAPPVEDEPVEEVATADEPTPETEHKEVGSELSGEEMETSKKRGKK